jgi:sugar phosphate isomerase/epimerase
MDRTRSFPYWEAIVSRHAVRTLVATTFALFSCGAIELVAGGDEPRPPGLANPLFAMNFALHVPTMGPDAQAALLKELGYPGTQYLGTLDDLAATFTAMDAADLSVFTVAVIPYDVPVDPGTTYPAVLKDAIRKLRGRPSLLLFQFVSSTYERSAADGDERAVALGRELADYAAEYGVRLAVYPHVNIWCERVDHAVRIVQRCERDNLGVCFNLFHWSQTDPHGDLPELVRQSLPHLFLVTINGTTPDGAVATLDHGSGRVERFLQPFIEQGYRGPIGLQCVGIAGDPRDNLTRSLDAWNELSSRLAPLAPTAR